MKTSHVINYPEAAMTQVTNNSTLWIGHLQGEPNNRICGQTFVCPTEGELDSINILSTIACDNCSVDLTIHQFNIKTKSWGSVMGSSTVRLQKSNTSKWINFPVAGLHLFPGNAYGFRLNSPSALVGIGETVGNIDHMPDNKGQEWTATTEDESGKYYSCFSIAYNIEVRA